MEIGILRDDFMKIQEEVQQAIQEILNQKKQIDKVVFIAAGGSNGGFYPAQYFLSREATQIRSECFTSNEFYYAPPKYVDEHTLAIICSMRGTPETCKAAQVAKDLGASTIALYVDESELTKICDICIQYESIAIDESRMERVNSSVGLMLSMTLMKAQEGFEHYEDAMQAFDQVDALYRQAVEETTPLAKAWALQNVDKKPIYVMGSGPAYGSDYIFSICNLEEMLQIDSPTINSCEFFHGPFEILTHQTSVFQLISVGRTRAADLRAVQFLKQYGGSRVYLLDGKQLGLYKIAEPIQEYFNHILFSPILNNVYMRELSYCIGKDYMTRKYMWQVPY